ncbi:MAG TPA: replication initiator, partial [Acidimicrobiales bacterium]
MNPTTNPTLVREAALIAGVCARPVVSHVTDLETGERRVVPIACGSTREDQCPPCAERARKLRMQQCREGWHLDTEPEHLPPEEDQADEDGDGQAEDDETGDRRVRSTRRRQDAPELPRVPME